MFLLSSLEKSDILGPSLQGQGYSLKMFNVQSYFMKLVDDTVEASVRHVRAFVHQYLSARLAEARAQIEQYGNRYTEAMLHALDTSKQGTAVCTPTPSHAWDCLMTGQEILIMYLVSIKEA